MSDDRRELIDRREQVQRHLVLLAKGEGGGAPSPARRRTSSQMLQYLLKHIEQQLQQTNEKGPQ